MNKKTERRKTKKEEERKEEEEEEEERKEERRKKMEMEMKSKTQRHLSPSNGEPLENDTLIRVLIIKVLEAKDLPLAETTPVSVVISFGDSVSVQTESGAPDSAPGGVAITCNHPHVSWLDEEFAFEIGRKELDSTALFSVLAGPGTQNEPLGVHAIGRFEECLPHRGTYQTWFQLEDSRGNEAGSLSVEFWIGERDEVEASFWDRAVKITLQHQEPFCLNLIEVKMLMKGLGMPHSDRDIEARFALGDQDRDGFLSAADLTDAFRGELALMADGGLGPQVGHGVRSEQSLRAKAFCEVVKGDGVHGPLQVPQSRGHGEICSEARQEGQDL